MFNGIAVELPFLKHILRSLKWVPIPAAREFLNTQPTTVEYSAKVFENSRSSSKTANIFMEILAEAEKDRNALSELVLVREARTPTVAGSETTATTLTFVIWRILSRPRLHKQLLGELQEKLPADCPDAELEWLPLMNAMIRATLRLYGAAPGTLPRNPPPSGATFGNVYLPEGTVVSTQAWSTHRDPAVWEKPGE
ncbi:Cytochrome P450 [Macrophomina phaseolina MS6]|uniref:Cytochrome P450 n=2 Tax=Macrophomina phaseolina TaxID=35725 RepID=K2RBZ9_MACPH|nr:Cytochrome P450 [Macrophomina phaseolina MS6]